MKRAFAIFVVGLLAASAPAWAGPIVVNFAPLGTVDGSNVTVPMPGCTNADGTGAPVTLTTTNRCTLDGITFSYDDYAWGIDFATVDELGILGTTGGMLALDFSTPATALTFSFSLVGSGAGSGTTLLDGVLALFPSGETWGVSAVPDQSGGESGLFTYTGLPFDRVQFLFSADEPVFLMGDISYEPASTQPVPEPASLVLLGTGLAGLARGLRRKRAAGR